MDINAYIKSLVNQLSSLKDSASTVLGAEHSAVAVINNSILTLQNPEGVENVQVTPAGFTAESYNTFIEEQVAVLGNVTPEDISDVVGLIPDANGNLIEVGDAEISFAQARGMVDEIIADAEEFGEDIEIEESVIITYTRLDNQTLTVDNIHTIINHPISEPLKRFGAIQLVAVRDGETPSQKNAVFAVLEEGDLPLQALALNIAAYKGVVPFPGLGSVQAVGTVNFVD